MTYGSNDHIIDSIATLFGRCAQKAFVSLYNRVKRANTEPAFILRELQVEIERIGTDARAVDKTDEILGLMPASPQKSMQELLCDVKCQVTYEDLVLYAFVDVARNVYKRPYLVYDEIKRVEYLKNIDDLEAMGRKIVKRRLKQTLAYANTSIQQQSEDRVAKHDVNDGGVDNAEDVDDGGVDDADDDHDGGVDDADDDHDGGIDDAEDDHDGGIDDAEDDHDGGVDDAEDDHDGGVDDAEDDHDGGIDDAEDDDGGVDDAEDDDGGVDDAEDDDGGDDNAEDDHDGGVDDAEDDDGGVDDAEDDHDGSDDGRQDAEDEGRQDAEDEGRQDAEDEDGERESNENGEHDNEECDDDEGIDSARCEADPDKISPSDALVKSITTELINDANIKTICIKNDNDDDDDNDDRQKPPKRQVYSKKLDELKTIKKKLQRGREPDSFF